MHQNVIVLEVSAGEEALAMGVCNTFGDHYLKMLLKRYPIASIKTRTDWVSSRWSGFMTICKQHKWIAVT